MTGSETTRFLTQGLEPRRVSLDCVKHCEQAKLAKLSAKQFFLMASSLAARVPSQA